MSETITLSESALSLLRHLLATKDAGVTNENRDAFRELARAGVMDPVSTFARGSESTFRFTDEGWNRRYEFLKAPAAVLPTGSP